MTKNNNPTPVIAEVVEKYLACGIPVVASALPSIRSFYEAGDWGSLADPTDPRDHAAAIDDAHDPLLGDCHVHRLTH